MVTIMEGLETGLQQSLSQGSDMFSLRDMYQSLTCSPGVIACLFAR